MQAKDINVIPEAPRDASNQLSRLQENTNPAQRFSPEIQRAGTSFMDIAAERERAAREVTRSTHDRLAEMRAQLARISPDFA